MPLVEPGLCCRERPSVSIPTGIRVICLFISLVIISLISIKINIKPVFLKAKFSSLLNGSICMASLYFMLSNQWMH